MSKSTMPSRDQKSNRDRKSGGKKSDRGGDRDRRKSRDEWNPPKSKFSATGGAWGGLYTDFGNAITDRNTVLPPVVYGGNTFSQSLNYFYDF